MSEVAEETITWQPIAQLTTCKPVLLKAPKNPMGVRETVFFGFKRSATVPYYFAVYFRDGQPAQMLVDPTHFASIEGL
jgi:hypothetical protein